MNKNKKYFLIIVALGALALSSIACDDPPTPTPISTVPLNETVTETANEALETAEKAQSTLCNLCLLGGVPEDCTGVCR